MAGLIVLDAGPIGLLCIRPGQPRRDHCRAWYDQHLFSGKLLCLPEIAVYEVKREYIRMGAKGHLARLDGLIRSSFYLPITTVVMDRAAENWAFVRQAGVPTASPDSLDADCILAAQAVQVAGAGDTVVVATTNLVHLSRFPGLDARFWDTIP